MPITNNLFKLTFPEGWKETTVHTFEGPHDSGTQHNLVLTVLPGLQKDIDLEAFAKQQTQTSAGMLPGFELLSEKPVAFFGNAPGVEVNYTYQPSDEIKFFQKQWYFAIGEKVYISTATFNREWQDTEYGKSGNLMSSGGLITVKKLKNDGTDDELNVARSAAKNPY